MKRLLLWFSFLMLSAIPMVAGDLDARDDSSGSGGTEVAEEDGLYLQHKRAVATRKYQTLMECAKGLDESGSSFFNSFEGVNFMPLIRQLNGWLLGPIGIFLMVWWILQLINENQGLGTREYVDIGKRLMIFILLSQNLELIMTMLASLQKSFPTVIETVLEESGDEALQFLHVEDPTVVDEISQAYADVSQTVIGKLLVHANTPDPQTALPRVTESAMRLFGALESKDIYCLHGQYSDTGEVPKQDLETRVLLHKYEYDDIVEAMGIGYQQFFASSGDVVIENAYLVKGAFYPESELGVANDDATITIEKMRQYKGQLHGLLLAQAAEANLIVGDLDADGEIKDPSDATEAGLMLNGKKPRAEPKGRIEKWLYEATISLGDGVVSVVIFLMTTFLYFTLKIGGVFIALTVWSVLSPKTDKIFMNTLKGVIVIVITPAIAQLYLSTWILWSNTIAMPPVGSENMLRAFTSNLGRSLGMGFLNIFAPIVLSFIAVRNAGKFVEGGRLAGGMTAIAVAGGTAATLATKGMIAPALAKGAMAAKGGKQLADASKITGGNKSIKNSDPTPKNSETPSTPNGGNVVGGDGQGLKSQSDAPTASEKASSDKVGAARAAAVSGGSGTASNPSRRISSVSDFLGPNNGHRTISGATMGDALNFAAKSKSK